MKKLLDIIIIFLLVFLIINLFNNDKQVEQKPEIVVSSIKTSYTIPAGIKLNIENNRNENLSFNTCENFKINNSGNIVSLDKSFCKDVVLNAGDKTDIDFSPEYKKFETTGNYLITATLDGKDIPITFEIENKGTIKKIFTELIYAPVYNLLVFLIKFLGSSLGWGIITVTVIIRLFLLWPQHKMMVSQRKLQAIQPKIKAVQEKHKGNHQVLGKEMMDLYKKEKVNPMGSCGFLLIQMPILLVIYNIILHIRDESNYYYIYEFLANFDISHISYNFYGLDLLSSGGISGIVLGLSVGVVQFIQIKLSIANNKAQSKDVVLEKKKGANDYSAMMPDAETMNKFMLYGMPAMVAVFTYTFPSGLGIYWGISTTFMIFQQLVVNKKIKTSR